MTPRIIALVPDLLVGSRIEEAARRLGAQAVGASSQVEAINLIRDGARLLIVDLGERGLDLAELAEASGRAGVPVIAFGPHVDQERRREAQAAGIQRVYARSRFLQDTQAVLAEQMAQRTES